MNEPVTIVVPVWNGRALLEPLIASLRRRSHFRSNLEQVHREVAMDRLPVVEQVVPVIITFHDTNDFTASHMEEYLRIIVEESQRVGLSVTSRPFYDDAETVERIAVLRSQIGVYARER